MRTRIFAGLIVANLLAGCAQIGGSAPTSSPQGRPVVTSRPSAAPPSVAPTSPLITPAPAPTGAAAAVIDAFFSGFARQNQPFHVDTGVDFTGTAGAQTESGTVTVNGDIHGQNFDGEVIALGERVLVRLVDGVAYGKEAGGEWITMPDFKQTQPLNPFGLLEPADVTYVGTAERNGRGVHELAFEKWIGGELEAEGLSRIQLLDNDFALFLTSKGIPVEAVLDFSMTGYLSGYARQFQFDYHVVYRFSNVGKPVNIQAPV